MKKFFLFLPVLLIIVNVSGCQFASSEFTFRLTDSGAELVKYTGHSTNVSIPNTFQEKPVYRIGEEAFAYSQIESLEIPSGVSEIGDRAFYWCQSLKNINLPNDLAVIGRQAFLGNTSITKIQLGDKVQEIQQEAFANTNLSEISIPASVSRIGAGAFTNTNNLEFITVAQENTKYISKEQILYNKEQTEIILVPTKKDLSGYTVPTSVKEIADFAFNGCSSLKELHLPSGFMRIGQSAFSNCSALYKIDFPDSLEFIGDNAFQGTKWMSSQQQEYVTVNGKLLLAYRGNAAEIKVPKGIVSVSYHDVTKDIEKVRILNLSSEVQSVTPGFLKAYNFDYFLVDSSNCYYSSENTILYNKDKTVLICCPLRYNDSNFTIKEGVETINDYAFSRCITIKSVVLPKSVKEIRTGAFSNCTVLEKLVIPSEVTDIKTDAFIGSKQLTIYAEEKSAAGEYARNHGIPIKQSD